MVDFHNFVKWCENRFDDIVVKNNEVRINSIFIEDNKHHLWCSPSGGKKKIEDGCYQCFKTGNKGTLLGLIMKVDNCSYHEAKETLDSGVYHIGDLEDKLENFFKEEENIKIKLEFPSEITVLPPHAVQYLRKRKISEKGFLYCATGDYQNRIIIPYYDKNGRLIYYNGRALKGDPRYLGPPKSCGVGKSEVLFSPLWAPSKEKVFLVEGEFDAITLFQCGFYSVACGGKNLSDKQLLFLLDYDICISVDRDKAGFDALIEIGNKLLKRGFNVSYVRPPKGFKDWNEVLVKLNEKSIMEYIVKNEKKYDSWTGDTLLFNNL